MLQIAWKVNITRTDEKETQAHSGSQFWYIRLGHNKHIFKTVEGVCDWAEMEYH